MSIINITPNPDKRKKYFGSITQSNCLEGISLIPVQLLGAIPVRRQSLSCVIHCQEFKFIDGDINSFLFRFPSVNSTDDYKLEVFNGSWSEVVTGNPSNVLGLESGEKFNIGFDVSYPTYGGFKLDWGLIFSNFGEGKYRFVVDNTDVNLKQYSLHINLFADTCDNKNSSFYASWESKGRFENFEFTENNNLPQFFDLVNMNIPWEDGCRYFGRLDKGEPETEDIIVTLFNFEKKKHYSEKNETFILRIFKSSLEVVDRFYYYGLDSGKIKVTDDNLDANYKFDQINLINDNNSYSKEEFPTNNSVYNIEFTLKSAYDKGYKPC